MTILRENNTKFAESRSASMLSEQAETLLEKIQLDVINDKGMPIEGHTASIKAMNAQLSGISGHGLEHKQIKVKCRFYIRIAKVFEDSGTTRLATNVIFESQ